MREPRLGEPRRAPGKALLERGLFQRAAQTGGKVEQGKLEVRLGFEGHTGVCLLQHLQPLKGVFPDPATSTVTSGLGARASHAHTVHSALTQTLSNKNKNKCKFKSRVPRDQNPRRKCKHDTAHG